MCAVTLVLRCYLLLNHHTPEVDQKLAEAPSSTQGGTGSASPGGSHLAAQPGNRSILRVWILIIMEKNEVAND